MISIKERNEKYYTEKGINALKERLRSLASFLNKGKYPVINVKILGFGNLNIETQEELLGRIIELSTITGEVPTFQQTITKDTNGNMIKKLEVIEWQTEQDLM